MVSSRLTWGFSICTSRCKRLDSSCAELTDCSAPLSAPANPPSTPLAVAPPAPAARPRLGGRIEVGMATGVSLRSIASFLVTAWRQSSGSGQKNIKRKYEGKSRLIQEPGSACCPNNAPQHARQPRPKRWRCMPHPYSYLDPYLDPYFVACHPCAQAMTLQSTGALCSPCWPGGLGGCGGGGGASSSGSGRFGRTAPAAQGVGTVAALAAGGDRVGGAAPRQRPGSTPPAYQRGAVRRQHLGPVG